MASIFKFLKRFISDGIYLIGCDRLIACQMFVHVNKSSPGNNLLYAHHKLKEKPQEEEIEEKGLAPVGSLMFSWNGGSI
jgi:hypothetical protein